MVTPITEIDISQITHLGGLLFLPQSGLFGYGSSRPGLFPKQNKLYSINKFSGDASELMGNSLASIASDGCSCPFSFSFTNDVPAAGMYCNNDKNTFILKITNNSFNAIENAILKDTMAVGIVIEEISGLFLGNITVGTGVGTDILEITDFLIPPKSTVEIKIKVLSIDAIIGATLNQAFLYNLPERFNGMMASDDRSTSGVLGDPSTFYISARKLENITWDVISPTDCLKANDGQIIVRSEQFFPGQEFEVKLRNKIGWDEFTFRVEIDETNSFLLDSLLPGDYQVFELRSVSDNCSMAIKDTTILLEAPNHLLDINVKSNSPVCEGQNLLLNSTIYPDGNIRWTGPNFFGSEDLDPIIENVGPKQSGEYKTVVKYGYCKQLESLDVKIYPEINSTIIGESQYCERERVVLDADGQGDQLEYTWSGPDNLIQFDSTLIISAISQDQSGYYELMTDNGACSDTIGIDIIVLATPKISPMDALIADFCAPVILKPQVISEDELSYTWLPREGLSCYNCLTPQLQPIVQSKYQLMVENDYLCRDSADIKIVLEKENLGYAPNAFVRYSENGNDHFSFYPRCIVQHTHRMDIYDRWGNNLYTSTANTWDQEITSWDGKTIDGRIVNSGVYIWSVEVELVDGTIQYLTGNVTLMD